MKNLVKKVNYRYHPLPFLQYSPFTESCYQLALGVFQILKALFCQDPTNNTNGSTSLQVNIILVIYKSRNYSMHTYFSVVILTKMSPKKVYSKIRAYFLSKSEQKSRPKNYPKMQTSLHSISSLGIPIPDFSKSSCFISFIL